MRRQLNIVLATPAMQTTEPAPNSRVTMSLWRRGSRDRHRVGSGRNTMKKSHEVFTTPGDEEVDFFRDAVLGAECDCPIV